MAAELERALREVRDTLLENAVSPRVEEPADIDLHYCRYVAETVAERLGDEYGVEVVTDGGRGFVHTWLSYEGRHYDAECVDGVNDYRHLPFFERHPEAVVHVERGAVDGASLRDRGREPLYPVTASAGTRGGPSWAVTAADRTFAIAGVLVGLLVLAVGMCGEWAIHGHLVGQAVQFQPLFLDFEIVGELLLLMAPVIFLLLRPSFRVDAE